MPSPAEYEEQHLWNLRRAERDRARRRDEAYRAMVEALEPFANLMPHVQRKPTHSDDDPIWATNEQTITQGHVREACAALALARQVEG